MLCIFNRIKAGLTFYVEVRNVVVPGISGIYSVSFYKLSWKNSIVIYDLIIAGNSSSRHCSKMKQNNKKVVLKSVGEAMLPDL